MANLVFDGNWRVFDVSTIADPTAPTVAEIGAGTEITAFLPKDGWEESPTFNRVDFGKLSTTFGGEGLGTWRTSVDVTILLDDNADTAWDLYQTHARSTYMVVLPYKGTGAVAAADVARVYEVETSQAVPLATAENQRQMAMVAVAVREYPDYDVTVAA